MKTKNNLQRRYLGVLCHKFYYRRNKLSSHFYHLMLLINILGLSFLSIQTQAQFPSTMELGNLCGPNGFVVNGISSIDQVGSAIGSAGDINGDGYDDLIFGTFAGDPNGSNSGESYVVFGTPNGFNASLDLSALDGTNGFTLNGIDAGDGAGTAVSSAGDFNGDGYNDIIIGADDADPNDFGFSFGSGAAYVVFGSSNGFSPVIELSALDGTNGLSLNGVDERDGAGTTVSSAGDFNGDGYDDIMIGAPDADPNGGSSGATYIVFGGTTSLGASFNLSDLDGTNGLVINGLTGGEYSGSSISSAGDFNGDGVDDVIIGGPDGSFGPETGTSYIVFGSTGGFAASLELSDLDGANGFALNGINEGDLSGFSVSSAGDFNSDGFDDIIIGAHFADPNGNRSGQSYIVFGSTGGFSPSLNLSDLDGTNGFTINGLNEGDQLGYSVSSAGDINNDGVDDVIIGARSVDLSANFTGASYVVFGSTGSFGSILYLTNLDGTNGFVLNGIDGGDFSGTSVSSAGDVNGDGVEDLIIGAPSADPNASSSGESYVVFGSCGPNLLVQGNETLIPNCSDTPQVEDLTLFEGVCAESQSYVLDNSLGTEPLIINSIVSSNPAFSIGLNNFPINVPAGSGSTLLLPISYTATGNSPEVSEITIESNDCNDLTYTFNIQYQDGEPDCDDGCPLTDDVFVVESCECTNILPDVDDGCDLTTDSFDASTCMIVNAFPDVDDGCDLTTDFFDATNCVIVNSPPLVNDDCSLTADSFDASTCTIINAEPDCDDNICNTSDEFDSVNCMCVNTELSPVDCGSTCLEYNTLTCECESITQPSCDPTCETFDEETCTCEECEISIECPADTTIDCTADISPDALGYVSVSSNCGELVPTYTDQVFTELIGEDLISGVCSVIYRNWKVEDNCSIFESCIQKIYIVDDESPTIVCPEGLEVFELTCGDVDHLQTQLSSLIASITATDNCDEQIDAVEETYNPSNWPTCLALEDSVSITFWATDACGNNGYKSFPVVIVDTELPEVSVPANLHIDCSELEDLVALETTINNWFDMAIYSDNCGIDTTFNTLVDVDTLACTGPGGIKITFDAIDHCGNGIWGVSRIIISDELSPEITVPEDLYLDCNSVDSAITTWLASASVTDNCTADLTLENDFDSDIVLSCTENSSVLVTFTATDNCGKVGTNTAYIHYEDTSAPEFNQPTGLQPLYLSCYNEDSIAAWLQVLTATDCGQPVEVVNNYVPNTPYGRCADDPDRQVSVAFSATDACGNTSVVLTAIIVADEIPPTFEEPIPEPLILECGNYTQNDIDVWLAGFTAWDNCSGEPAIVENDYSGTNVNCEGGGMTITFTATDTCGNTSTISSTISLNDTEPAVFDFIPEPLVLSCGYDESVLTNWLNSATATDICAGELEVVPENFTGGLGNVCDDSGERTVVFIAIDDCGNVAKDSSTIVLLDDIAPTLTTNIPTAFPNPFEFGDTLHFNCSQIPLMDSTFVTASDDCDEEVFVQFCENVVYEDECDIVYYCFWKAEDDCGNMTEAGVYVKTDKVIFNELTIECPEPAEVSCEYLDDLDPHVGVPTATGCGNLNITYYDDLADLVDGYCGGIILRTWTVEDECGQSKSCTQVITIVDNEAPTVILNLPSYLEAFAFEFGDTLYFNCSSIPLFNASHVSATDNCDDNPEVKFYDYYVQNQICSVFYECGWEATDACGNTTVKKVYLYVEKEQETPLTLSCPGDIDLTCGDSIHPDDLGYATASGCVSGEITYSDDDTNLIGCGGTGYITRTWSATNNCGEVVTCDQIIHLTDDVAPEISLISSATFEFGDTLSASCGMLPDIGVDYVTATDNCDGEVLITFSETIYGEEECHTLLQCIWTATDVCGQSTSKHIFMYLENPGPVTLYCPADLILECSGENPNPAITGFASVSGCGNITVDYTDTGSCESGFIYRTWSASNECGVAASCTQTIVVKEGVNNGALALRVFLQGAMGGTESELMRDNLRQEGFVPMLEPYTTIGNFDNLMSTPVEIADASVLTVEGENAIVDWIVLEFRDDNDSEIIASTRFALLQRDGDIVELDGVSPITVFPTGNYHIAIRHRNHLGVMTENALVLGGAEGASFDFSNPTSATYGNNAQMQYDENCMALWAGNANANGNVIYQGGDGDATVPFFDVVTADENEFGLPNYILPGYYEGDVDMSCEVIYQGEGNDLWLMFYNILNHPDNESGLMNFIIEEQLPENED